VKVRLNEFPSLFSAESIVSKSCRWISLCTFRRTHYTIRKNTKRV